MLLVSRAKLIFVNGQKNLVSLERVQDLRKQGIKLEIGHNSNMLIRMEQQKKRLEGRRLTT